jgi:hypothetical protein
MVSYRLAKVHGRLKVALCTKRWFELEAKDIWTKIFSLRYHLRQLVDVPPRL